MLSFTHFKYCPRCASGNIVAEDENSMRCLACGYLYFHNAAAAVGGILTYQGKILLLQRAMEPMKGKWDAPGGFVGYRESAEEALRRETYEETSLLIDSLQYLGASSNVYIYRDVTYFTSDIFYVGTVASLDKISLSDEIADYRLIEPSKINMDELAFDSLREMVKKYICRFS